MDPRGPRLRHLTKPLQVCRATTGGAARSISTSPCRTTTRGAADSVSALPAGGVLAFGRAVAR